MKNLGKAPSRSYAVAVAAVAVAAVARQHRRQRVTIGWAYDGVGNMAPFDGPALATAKAHIKRSTRPAVRSSS